MNDRPVRPDDDEASIIAILSILRGYRRRLLAGAAVGASLVLAAGTIYFVIQPTQWVGSLEFRPTFANIQDGLYPSGLAFATSDITTPEVLDVVHAQNDVERFCGRDAFRSAFFVERTSPGLKEFDAGYQARLANAALPAVERDRLLFEYQERRKSFPRRFELRFLRPASCTRLPESIVAKVLDDVLKGWAEHVLKTGIAPVGRPEIPAPAALSTVAIVEHAAVRASMIRDVLASASAAIAELGKLSGAASLPGSDDQMTFASARSRLKEFETHVDHLIVASAGGAREARPWFEEVHRAAIARRDAATARADAYLLALREFSGRPALKPAETADDGTPSPLDGPLVDRVLLMSVPNTVYRQQLTDGMLAASREAIQQGTEADRLRRVLDAIGRAGSGTLSQSEINRRLDLIVKDASDVLRQANNARDELSRRVHRLAASLYQVDGGFGVEEQYAFTAGRLIVLTLATLFALLLGGSMIALVHHGMAARSSVAGISG